MTVNVLRHPPPLSIHENRRYTLRILIGIPWSAQKIGIEKEIKMEISPFVNHLNREDVYFTICNTKYNTQYSVSQTEICVIVKSEVMVMIVFMKDLCQ